MTQRDYIAFAKEYRTLLQGEGLKYYTAQHLFNDMVQITANIFEKDNPKFDKMRFLDAVYDEWNTKVNK